MRISLLLLFATLAFASCKKDFGAKDLDGKWKMIQYYDRSTSSMNNKPDASMEMYLEINGNNFKASSTSKTHCEGTFTLEGDKILFTTTNTNFDIINDKWADMFLWAIQSCMLQSTYPCKPSTLEWQRSNQIRINTVLKMDIILRKM